MCYSYSRSREKIQVALVHAFRHNSLNEKCVVQFRATHADLSILTSRSSISSPREVTLKNFARLFGGLYSH